MGKKIHRDQTIIEQLTHEIAWYKRHKFAKRSEQLSPDQGSLLDDLLDTDIAAIEAELKAVNPRLLQPNPPTAQAHTAAGTISAHCDPPRTGEHPMRLRLPAATHR